jgi:FkbM family methyltransferase
MISAIKRILIQITPHRVLELYGLHLYGLVQDLLSETAKTSYSQMGEDLVISEYFKGQFHGIYVDIGAFHPKKYSNTHLLSRRGWTGINIEPNPEQYKVFPNARPKDINLNFGIGPYKGHLPYYSFNHPAVNTFNHHLAQIWNEKKNFHLKETLSIPIFPLSDVLAEYLPKLSDKRVIDVMTIDVEGMDLDVLKSNDWDKYSPTLLLVEDGEALGGKWHIDESQIYKYVLSKGYQLYRISGITMVFVRRTG